MWPSLEELAEEMQTFARERDWDQFHTPKNLCMALVGEAGELAAEFQWLSPSESEAVHLGPEKLRAVEDEVADVLIYLIRLVDRLEMDLAGAVGRKVAANRARYTVGQSFGSADKVD